MKSTKSIRRTIREVIKETFDKSNEVAPKTVNNLPKNEPLVIAEPHQLQDTSKPEEVGDPVIDVILNSFLKKMPAKGKKDVSDTDTPNADNN
jgi:hypothetical protein